jgi:hypothetical protein
MREWTLDWLVTRWWIGLGILAVLVIVAVALWFRSHCNDRRAWKQAWKSRDQ